MEVGNNSFVRNVLLPQSRKGYGFTHSRTLKTAEWTQISHCNIHSKHDGTFKTVKMKDCV